jgi:CoA:oxalate CoA-transferase
MNDAASAHPLDGRLVLDLTTALAGPYATLLLAGLGARVVKIENPRGGDGARNNSPYLATDGLAVARGGDAAMSVSMLVRGRNKESVALDLKSDAGRAVLFDLIRRADILVENFSPGVTRRLGIDYARVREANPRLVYTSISGFGQTETTGSGKAMDTIVQALSGIMMTSGELDDGPVRVGLPVGDLITPLYAVIGTLAAVVRADATGAGDHVDVSMLGALTSFVACEPFDAVEALGLPLRTGSFVPRLAPFGNFPTTDGWIALCGPTDAFMRGLARAMGAPELAEDPRFATRDARVANADALHELIGAWTRSARRAEVIDALEAEGVPAGAIRTPADAVRDPRVLERGDVVRLHHPDLPDEPALYGPGVPVHFAQADASLERPAPRLGQHTDAVLREVLGYDDDRIDALRAGGVL